MSKQHDVVNLFRVLRVLNVAKRTLAREEYLVNKVKNIPGSLLVQFWEQEKEGERKGRLEHLIAIKLNTYNPIIRTNPVPELYYGYLAEVSDIDAIVELMKNTNEKIHTVARSKYIEFFDRYLEQEEKTKKEKIIQFNGGN